MINKKVSWDDCKAGRKEQADLLTKMLENRYEILKQRAEKDDSLINTFSLNLDAGWGFGKTHFIERWANDLSDKHVVLMFNAWEHDYQKDAMTCLLSALLTQISEYFSEISSTNDKIKKKLKTVGSAMANFAKSAAPAAINVISTATLGVKLGSLITSDPEHSDTDEAVEKLTGLLGGKMAEQLFSNKEKYGKALAVFKESMRELINAIETETKYELPIYVFIDDLDRCRPDFTLEIIECVKHILEIDSLYFVFATDAEQLEKSIKAIYGEGLDSEKYLKRVFNRECKLKDPNYERFSEYLFDKGCFSPHGLSPNEVIFPEECDNDQLLVVLLKRHFYFITKLYGLNLRSQISCREQIEDMLHGRKGNVTIAIPLIHLVVLWNIKKDLAERQSSSEQLLEKELCVNKEHVTLDSAERLTIGSKNARDLYYIEMINYNYICNHRSPFEIGMDGQNESVHYKRGLSLNISRAYNQSKNNVLHYEHMLEQIKMIA